MIIGHLFSTMAVLGGDILSVLSIIGSTVVLLDSFVYKSHLHRLEKFLDLSLVCLIMGTLGQLTIEYTGAKVDRVGLLQIRVILVNRLLALSFLSLLVSWFIRRSGLQPVRFWRNGYSSILRGAKQVDRLVPGTRYMNKDIVSMTNQFAFYHRLAWLESWNFRRHISWLEGDTVSLEYLLDFAKELKTREVDSITIRKIIEAILAWYHREVHDDRLLDPVPRERLPAMLQILAFFYGKSGRVHRRYRELFLRILDAEEEIKKYQASSHGIASEQFRVEAAKAISDLSRDWGKWDPAYLNNGAVHLLRYLTNIAKKARNLKMFTQFQIEAANLLAKIGLWYPGEKLDSLERIAEKVSDEQSFTFVFHDIVPVLGLIPTASVLGISKDFQEFEMYCPQIHGQLHWWGAQYITLISRVKDTSELSHLLSFLQTLARHKRLEKYLYYIQFHPSGTLFAHISGQMAYFRSHVSEIYPKQDWTAGGDEQFMDGLIDRFEEHLVQNLLYTLWSSVFGSRKLRWEFSRFTDYISYGMISLDWTKDDDKMRSYWNYNQGAGSEQKRFMDTLGPLALSLIRQLEFAETETLFDLLPRYLGIEEFTQSVKVPVQWEKKLQYSEGYDKYVGFYGEELEVAIPIGFIDHPFTFERPYLQNAVDLLSNVDNVRETIQAYNQS